MTSAMWPLADDVTPYRGIGDVRLRRLGEEIVDDGFVSTSASRRTSQNFATGLQDGGGTVVPDPGAPWAA